MERLAKVGFNQSYTYFAWRQSAWELREYFTDLATRTVDYFRPERVAEHARHPHRAAAARRAGDVRQPGDPRRHAERQLGHLRPGVRTARASCDQARIGGVPRLGEVPGAHVAARRPRVDRAADRAAQRDPPRQPGAAAPAHASLPRRRRARHPLLQQDRPTRSGRSDPLRRQHRRPQPSVRQRPRRPPQLRARARRRRRVRRPRPARRWRVPLARLAQLRRSHAGSWPGPRVRGAPRR